MHGPQLDHRTFTHTGWKLEVVRVRCPRIFTNSTNDAAYITIDVVRDILFSYFVHLELKSLSITLLGRSVLNGQCLAPYPRRECRVELVALSVLVKP